MNVNDPRFTEWRTDPAKYFLIAFGENDSNSALYPDPKPVGTEVARFQTEIEALVDAVVALGGIPILIGMGAVDFPSHYTADMTAAWAPYDAAKAAVATAKGCGYVDIATPMAAAIAGGNWDFRIRSDYVTWDASNDAAHAGDPTKAWWTNVHYNLAGCRFVADRILASGLIVP
jgi:hypothetical protein